MSSGRVSSWTRLKFPSSDALEPSIFKPLAIGDDNNRVHDAYYGPIAESNYEHLLVAIWESCQDYEEFRASVQYREFLVGLTTASAPTEPTTQVVDFNRIAFWRRFRPKTEIRTVYSPADLPPQMREAVGSLHGLVLTMSVGIDGSKAHLTPYRGLGCL
ncbi:hypothetical protein F5Y10DRAFT_243411 [Nemania abortiva]|nr:hypothetical protein F5Y10DRAFT_243411 [Nemania abortiva]